MVAPSGDDSHRAWLRDARLRGPWFLFGQPAADLNGRRLADMQAFLRSLVVLPYGERVATTWGQRQAGAQLRGRPLPANDSCGGMLSGPRPASGEDQCQGLRGLRRSRRPVGCRRLIAPDPVGILRRGSHPAWAASCARIHRSTSVRRYTTRRPRRKLWGPMPRCRQYRSVATGRRSIAATSVMVSS